MKIVLKITIIAVALVALISLPAILEAQQKSVKKPTLVTVNKPYSGTTAPIIELTGSAYFVTLSTLAAESAGKVKQIFVNEGDTVKKGSRLIQLDDEMLKYSLQSSIATTNQAKSNLAKAKRDYNRNKNLYDKNAIALSIYENTETDYFNAQNEYNSARANQNKLESEIDKMLIRSPFKGSVTSRNVDIGEWVTVGGVVATIASDDYEARVYLPEKILPFVNKNDVITLLTNGKKLTGKVLSINKRGDIVTRTFLSRIYLGNASYLREGIIITARIPSAKPVTALFVKRDTIITRNFSKGVYIESAGVAKFIPVTIVGYKGKDIGVKSNLKLTDNVILKGNNSIRNGSAVTITGNK